LHRAQLAPALFFAAAVAFAPALVPQQPPKADTVARATLRHDSAVSQARSADSLYLSILEKTNQQLSLLSNPYGLFVSALGLLFAIAAIVVGVLLFRQSRDYRALITASVRKYETILDALVRDRLEQMQGQVAQLLVESKEELKTATEEQRTNIEQKIAALERKRDEIRQTELTNFTAAGGGLLGGSGIVIETATSNLGFSAFAPNIRIAPDFRIVDRRTCSNCGKAFDVPDVPLGVVYISGRDINCPHCGFKIHLPA